ncbi:hypothetical protein RD1_0070 [Roseobacter denitrificans OCh 114]|uniref:Uncharacterized protein n=1 Tax=Roseobacter denitrificans (strain ATCC 33942 / OCh 114) TaxID=375451 RepID=Q16DY7_ROSDO|nr:hypothetical protein RD1_0070 [Roseobacter denitrificans OCh 114]
MTPQVALSPYIDPYALLEPATPAGLVTRFYQRCAPYF